MFDVTVEGQTVLDDFDILAQTGGNINQSLVQSTGPVAVSGDGVLNIDFSASANVGKVSGIVIRAAEPGDPGTPPPPLPPPPPPIPPIPPTPPTPPEGAGAGQVTLDFANDTNLAGGSSFGFNSVILANTTPADLADGVTVTRVTIDLGTAVIADLVFDTGDPPAGDDANRAFTIGNPLTGVDLSVGIDPQDVTVTETQPLGNGSRVLNLDFAPGTFGAGDSLAFGVDIDPLSAFSGVGGGTVAGFELAGATLTASFSDGSVAVGQIVADDSTTTGGTAVAIVGQNLAAPTVTFGDGTTGPRVVNDPALPIVVDAGPGNAGGTLRLFVLDQSFVTPDGAGVPANGQPIGPFSTNGANAFTVIVDVTLDANGQFAGTVPVTRTDLSSNIDDAQLGINAVFAAVVDADGNEGLVSSPLVVEFDPSAPSPTVPTPPTTPPPTTPTPPTMSSGPVRIQAESFDVTGGFFTETLSAADGDAVIRLDFEGDTGVATVSLPVGGPDEIVSGLNNITLVLFDEDDGESTLQIELIRADSTVVSLGTVVLDQDGGRGGGQAANLRSIVFNNVAVESGDLLLIAGQSDNREAVRIDYVEFNAVV